MHDINRKNTSRAIQIANTNWTIQRNGKIQIGEIHIGNDKSKSTTWKMQVGKQIGQCKSESTYRKNTNREIPFVNDKLENINLEIQIGNYTSEHTVRKIQFGKIQIRKCKSEIQIETYKPKIHIGEIHI